MLTSNAHLFDISWSNGMLRCNARYIDSQESSVRYLYSPGGSLKYPSGPTTLLSDQLGGMLKKTGQHKTLIVF